jgi:hypothetical protein
MAFTLPMKGNYRSQVIIKKYYCVVIRKNLIDNSEVIYWGRSLSFQIPQKSNNHAHFTYRASLT